MAPDPLVSIVIPHYGNGRFLLDAVNSALRQTYSNIEVIVVDDGDFKCHAKEVLSVISDLRLRVLVHVRNRGASWSRNSGIEAARGELILPLDSDDLLAPQFLEKTIPLLEDDSVGGVYTAVKLFGSQEKILSTEWTVLGILKGETSAQVCMLYRKALHKQLGGYNTELKYGEDCDFFLRAIKNGWKFIQVREPLYMYRRHDGSTCHQAPSLFSSAEGIQWYVNAAQDHRDLYSAHLGEIVKHKEQRHWELQREYRHLHTEFHKLLKLYNHLENAAQQSAKHQKSFSHRLKSVPGTLFLRIMRIFG